MLWGVSMKQMSLLVDRWPMPNVTTDGKAKSGLPVGEIADTIGLDVM